jgi:hypothetical protein
LSSYVARGIPRLGVTLQLGPLIPSAIMPIDHVISARPRSVVMDWWAGSIPNRITSLIYINFD